MQTFNEIQHNCIAINECLNDIKETMDSYSYAIGILGYEAKFEALMNNMQIIHNDVQNEMLRQEQGVN